MMKLIGHSGCDILLLNKNDIYFVRKISKDKNYNSRLEIQFKKQKEFWHSIIQTPKIYDSGYLDDLFYFDMEYVNGVKFNDFIKVNNFNKTKYYFSVITDFIFSNIRDESLSFENVILNKINTIVNTNLIDNKVIENLKIISNKKIPSGYCHGDLTFENIIIANNSIYLIDFLDSFIDSPIIDISKLLQEFDMNWSNRNYPSDFSTIVKNHFLKIILLDRVVKEIADIPVLTLQRKLTLMRILPYATNLGIKLRLLDIINKQI